MAFTPVLVTNGAIFSDNGSNAPRAYGKGGEHFGVLPVSGATVVLVNSTTDVSLVIIPNGGSPGAIISLQVSGATYVWGYSSMYVDPTIDAIYVALFEERSNSGYTGKFTVNTGANTVTRVTPIYQNQTATKTGYLITSTPSEVVMNNNMVIGVGGWVSAVSGTAGATYAPLAYSYNPFLGTTTSMTGVVASANNQLATQTITSNYNEVASVVKIGSTAYALCGVPGASNLKLHQIVTTTGPNTVSSNILASYTMVSPLGINNHNESLGELCTDGTDLYFAYTDSTTTISIVKWNVIGATSSVVATITGLSKVTDLGIEYFNGNLWLGWCDGVTQTTTLEAVYATYSTTGTAITARTVVAGGDALGYIGSRMTVVGTKLLYGYSKGTVSPTSAYYGILATTGSIFTKSLADSITTSESLTKSMIDNESDAITLSDTITKSMIDNKSDAITLSDTIRKAMIDNESDAITLSDTIRKAMIDNESDSITTTDTVAKNLSAFKSLADSITTSDTISKTLAALKTLGDSFTISDTLIRAITKQVSDSIASSDTIVKATAKPISDSITSSDTISKVSLKTLTLSDAITSSDTISKGSLKTLMLSDAITSSDTISKALLKVATDTVSLLETFTKMSSKTVNDSTSLTDSIVRSVSKPLPDSITVTDSTVGKSVAKVQSDTVTISETFNKAMFKTMADTMTTSDSISRAILKAISLSDAITSTDSISNAISKIQTDVVSLTDSISKTNAKTVTVSDTVSLTDSISKASFKPASDSITLTDSISKANFKTVSDLVSITDIVSKAISKIQTDIVSVTDTRSIVSTFVRAFTDTFALSDVVVKTPGKMISDAITLSDSLTNKSIALLKIDPIGITELMISKTSSPLGLIKLLGLRELNILFAGQRNLSVNFVGQRDDLNISLNGGLPVAKTGQDFTMYAGETKNILITVTDSVTGIAVNLTGSTIKWAAKRYLDSLNSVYKDTTTGGIVITDALNGKFTVSLLPADTKALGGSFIHQAFVVDSSGNTSTVTVGTVAMNSSNV